jgi:hypothetical protein
VLLFSLAVVGGVALLAVTHRAEARQFWTDLGRLSPVAVATAFALILGQVSSQALRLWAIIPRDARLGMIRAGYIFAVGDWTNIFIPARGGDALKVLMMTRPERGHQMSLTKATGALLADKVVDIGTLIFLCAITGLLSVLVSSARALPVLWVVIGASVVLVLLLVSIRRGPAHWLAARQAGLRDLAAGLSSLKHPVRCLTSVSGGIAARVVEMLALQVLCGAIGYPLSLPQALFALVVVNLSVSVPVSIANLGVYEAGLAYGLTRAGMPVPASVMIATTHHMLELLGITLSAAGYALAFQWTKPTPGTSAAP